MRISRIWKRAVAKRPAANGFISILGSVVVAAVGVMVTAERTKGIGKPVDEYIEISDAVVLLFSAMAREIILRSRFHQINL